MLRGHMPHGPRCPCRAALLCCVAVMLGYCHGFKEHLLQPSLIQSRQFEAIQPGVSIPCQPDAAAAVPEPAVSDTATQSTTQLPFPGVLKIPLGNHAAIRVPGPLRSSRRPSRQLRAYTTAAAAAGAAVGRPAAPLLPYPQERGAVERFLSDAAKSGDAPYVIPTWFVVVVDPNNAWSTNVTVQQLEAQIGLLNRAYATGLPGSGGLVLESGTAKNSGTKIVPAGPAVQTHIVQARQGSSASRTRDLLAAQVAGRQLWRFSLMGVRYTTSTSPMCIGTQAEQGIKSAWRGKLVHEGRTTEDRTLVVYVSDITNNACKGAVAGYSVMFGYGNTPYDLVFWKQHSMAYKDGVVMDPRYLLNTGVQRESGSGALHGASSGAQLVHEIGHWMGLVHTFDGGCTQDTAATDQVEDTPAEAHPTQWSGVSMRDASSGCQYRDSCGNLAGQDMIENYMTYNNLACGRSFTPGQQARMLYLFRAVRKD